MGSCCSIRPNKIIQPSLSQSVNKMKEEGEGKNNELNATNPLEKANLNEGKNLVYPPHYQSNFKYLCYNFSKSLHCINTWKRNFTLFNDGLSKNFKNKAETLNTYFYLKLSDRLSASTSNKKMKKLYKTSNNNRVL